MLNKKKNILYRIFSLFLHIRIQNLCVFTLALYFSAAYLFSNKKSLILIFYDVKLHYIVLGTILTLSAGYLINHFYDSEKERFTKPFIFYFKSFIKKDELLKLYILLNSISLIITFINSFKLFIFFIIYQFLIWFYCHKLSKILFINNLFSVILTLFPFIVLLIHYGKFDFLIIKMAFFLIFLLFLKEILKDIHSISSDSLFNYKTLPNSYGINASKFNFILLFILLFLLSLNLMTEKDLYFMRIYFLLSSFMFIIPIFIILFKSFKYIYCIEIFIKIWLVIGIFSILFVKFPVYKS